MRGLCAFSFWFMILLAPAYAQDADGCERFAWSIARERAAFAGAAKINVTAGETLSSLPRGAVIIRLVPAADAKFKMPPERKVRVEQWFGGAVQFPAPQRAGIYQITMSQDVWIDVILQGRYTRSVGSTGRSDCLGVQKSVRLEMSAEPFIFQVSGAATDSLVIAIVPRDE